MRKFLIGAAALAAIATPLVATAGPASADVPRCQERVSVPSTSTTAAKFTVIQPRGTVGQFTDVWTHVYTIKVEPTTGAFSGTGSVTANGVGDVIWTETITGEFIDSDGNSVSDQVTFNTTPNEGATFNVTKAPMDSTTVLVESPWQPNVVEFKISEPVFETVTVNGETDFANHGEYVAAMGGGKAAAQKCTGMPLNSKKGQQVS
jgi:hypothetical protein